MSGAWRCDDKEVAYPMFELCAELSVDVIQFHKGVPFGLQNVEDLSPLDLEGAARDFREMTFIIHHPGLPYFEETISIASRFRNVYLSLSGNIGYGLVAPRLLQGQMGRLLMEVGSERLLWGSEAALAGGPAAYLDAFMDLEIPEDLQAGYGYPSITRWDKENILGRNVARLMNVDIEAKRGALSEVAG